MIQIRRENTIALLLLAAKQNYGKAWVSDGSDREGYFTVGLHLPTGDVAYYVPTEYRQNFFGLIVVDQPDLSEVPSERDSADRLLEWVKSL